MTVFTPLEEGDRIPALTIPAAPLGGLGWIPWAKSWAPKLIWQITQPHLLLINLPHAGNAMAGLASSLSEIQYMEVLCKF